MAKLNPRREKIETNAAFALKFGRAKKKSARRKARRARTIVRETAWLVSVGIDPAENGVPVA